MPSGSESFRLLTAQGYRLADQFGIASQFFTVAAFAVCKYKKTMQGVCKHPPCMVFLYLRKARFNALI